MTTNPQIVRAALSTWKEPVTIYEYPIWFWYHWPWVSFRQHTPPGTRFVCKNSLITGLGLRLERDFRHAVAVGSTLARKQMALDCHTSQMSRPDSDPRWLTLHDVADGEFLACFFQTFEIFRRYQIAGKQPSIPIGEGE